MVDELWDRQYRSGRDQLNEALHGGLTGVARRIYAGFRVLSRLQFSAPWDRQSRPAGCA